MGKLDGKVALITGGNGGIGLATAKRFVQEGAYVFITGRTQSKLDPAVKEVGSSVTGVQGDVARLADLDRLFEQIKKEKGKLDIVFANAGIAKYAPLGTIDEEHFDSIFDSNVKGRLFTVQKALPLLPDGASIILTASVVGSKGMPANIVYSATKAAIRSFARTWTTDLKARRIRVNAISPGPIDTEGLRELIRSAQAGQDRLKSLSSVVPMERMGNPMRSRRPPCSWRRTTAASLLESSCLSTAASRRCRGTRAKLCRFLTRHAPLMMPLKVINMTTRQINIQRLSVSSTKPFEIVVAGLNAADGHPDTMTVPIEERADGVHLSDDATANFLAPYENAEALQVAVDLDDKVRDLLAEAAGS